jgi:hypothetical protein
VLGGASGGRYHGGGREIFLVDKACATGRCNGVAHKQSQKTVRRANQDGWAMFGARHASSAGDCFHSEATPGRGLEGARPMTQHHCLQQMHRDLRRRSARVDSVCLHSCTPEPHAAALLPRTARQHSRRRPIHPQQRCTRRSEHAKRHRNLQSVSCHGGQDNHTSTLC